MSNFPSAFYLPVWLHILDFNKKNKKNPGEKKLGGSYTKILHFKLTLKAASYKTSVIQPLTSHLTKHPSKTSKTYWAKRTRS